MDSGLNFDECLTVYLKMSILSTNSLNQISREIYDFETFYLTTGAPKMIHFRHICNGMHSVCCGERTLAQDLGYSDVIGGPVWPRNMGGREKATGNGERVYNISSNQSGLKDKNGPGPGHWYTLVRVLVL